MRTALLALVVLASCVSACFAQPVIVCTTTIVGDVVSRIGGSSVEVQTLLPVGADPHTFEPTPQDLVTLADASLIFSNGADLEESLETFLNSAAAPVVALSDTLELLPIEHRTEDGHGEDHEEEDYHEHGQFDPHVWLDPAYVSSWSEIIERELILIAPDDAADIRARAAAYRDELRALDQWIRETVSVLPADRRRLVTDHSVFAYFAARYGFTQVGTILPGGTTASEPSARELAEVIDSIRALNVRVIFTGEVVASSLAQQVAQDTGTTLVYVFTGTLSDSDGPAASYIEFMRFNVQTIVDALADVP